MKQGDGASVAVIFQMRMFDESRVIWNRVRIQDRSRGS